MKKYSLFSFVFLFCFYSYGQNPAPGLKQTKSILLMNGVLHIGNGKMIENSLVGFRDGIIDLVADATTSKIDMSKYDTIIRLGGQHVYPAFIAPNSTIGLTEVDAVRATLDFSEVGGMNPHVRALIAFNTDSKIISTVRTNGVLYCQVTPRGGTISGTSSVVSLDAWNWEDAVVSTDDGVHLNYPRLPFRIRNEREGEDPLAVYESSLIQLNKYFADAVSYLNSPDQQEKNLYFEALRGVFSGKQRIYIHVDYVKDMLSSIDFCSKFNFPKPVFVGGKDAWKITPQLRACKIPVMINRIHDLPSFQEDDIDLPYKLAYLLARDSVEFCLQNEGDMEAMNTRKIGRAHV